MFPFGHVGLTLALVEGLRSRWHPLALVDYRLVAVGAMLPDLIDKPVGHWLLDWGNGRIYAHTLLFAALLWGAFALLRGRAGRAGAAALVVAALAIGSTTHLLFDEMWGAPGTLLWPLFGWAFPHLHYDPVRWIDSLLHNPYVQVTETVGAMGLAWVAWRIHARGELPRYLPWASRRTVK